MKRRDFIKYSAPIVVGAPFLPLLAKAAAVEESALRFSPDGTTLYADDVPHACETAWDISTVSGRGETGDLYLDIENQAMYVSRGYIRNKLGLKTPDWVEFK